jgi:hypothetical protein
VTYLSKCLGPGLISIYPASHRSVSASCEDAILVPLPDRQSQKLVLRLRRSTLIEQRQILNSLHTNEPSRYYPATPITTPFDILDSNLTTSKSLHGLSQTDCLHRAPCLTTQCTTPVHAPTAKAHAIGTYLPIHPIHYPRPSSLPLDPFTA